MKLLRSQQRCCGASGWRGWRWPRSCSPVGPLLPEELMPGANRRCWRFTLFAVVITSGALAAFSPVAKPLRIAWLICLLDTALVTAVVAATGGPARSSPSSTSCR